MASAAAAFRALHSGDDLLILPNCWDAASAALTAAAGARAIATSSAALAWSCGYPDGSALPPDDLLHAVAAIRRVVGELPVSVDLEDGYSSDPATVASLVARLVKIGVAGINLEDGGGDPALLAAKIAAIKRFSGSEIFVNARTDVYLRGIASGEAALRETIARARAYEHAGADGFYPIAASDERDVREFTAATPLPVNVLAVPGLPDARALRGWGVRRLSAGAALAEFAFGDVRRAAGTFLSSGEFESAVFERSAGFDAMNALFIDGSGSSPDAR